MDGKLTIVTKLISPDPASDPFMNGTFDKLGDDSKQELGRSMTRKSVDTAFGIMQEQNEPIRTSLSRRTSLDPRTPPRTPRFDPLFLIGLRSAELPRSTSPEADDSDERRPGLEPRGSSETTAVPPLLGQPPLTPQALSVPPSALSTHRLRMHNHAHSGGAAKMPKLENIVVRIEVIDTGVGIRASDMKDLKLFSPYVQTEIGCVPLI